jgi:hypothetical protein
VECIYALAFRGNPGLLSGRVTTIFGESIHFASSKRAVAYSKNLEDPSGTPERLQAVEDPHILQDSVAICSYREELACKGALW